MKRHPALVPLSSHHQHVLVQAQRLMGVRSSSEIDRKKAVEDFLHHWLEEGIDHFREEEEILIPTYARFGNVYREEIAELLQQHMEIRGRAEMLVRSFENHVVPEALALQELGELLEKHVRHEERTVYPMIEEAVPEKEMEWMNGRLLCEARLAWSD